MKALLFEVGTETFALDIGKIQRLVEAPELFPIPLAPPCLVGAINFHNHIIPVLDLAAYLGFAAGEQDPRLVILNLEQIRLGLSVSLVKNFFELEKGRTLPEASSSLLSGVGRLAVFPDGKSLRVLDLALLRESLESNLIPKRGKSWYSFGLFCPVWEPESREASPGRDGSRIAASSVPSLRGPRTGNP